MFFYGGGGLWVSGWGGGGREGVMVVVEGGFRGVSGLAEGFNFGSAGQKNDPKCRKGSILTPSRKNAQNS